MTAARDREATEVVEALIFHLLAYVNVIVWSHVLVTLFATK